MQKMNTALKTMTFDFFSRGMHKISAAALLQDRNSVLLDVRSRVEKETVSFSLSHHMKVLDIPTDEIPDRLDEIPHDQTIGIFCSSGVRSSMVFIYLKALGYEKVRALTGGYEELAAELKPGKLRKQLSSFGENA